MRFEQYPLRPAERPYDVEGLEQVKFKREAMRLEMTLPIEANERNRDNSAADSQKITSLVLTSASAKTEAHHGGVVVGTVRDGGLYLTPIDAVYQMRPSLRHLDAADSALKPRDYDREEREMQEEEERNLLPLQVQVRRRETTKQTEIRMSSHAYLRQRESEESWISLKPSMPGDDEAGALRAAVTTTRAESCGQTISAREYLDALCPVSGSKRVAPEDEDANTLGDGSGLSKSQLASLPIERRIRTLFAKGQKSVMKFSRIRQFVTENIEVDRLIEVIQDCAHLVQGNWVAKSTLRCGGNVTWENMRDSALFQFARARNVKPELVSNCLKRNGTKPDPTLAKMRREVLAEFSSPRGYGSAADGFEFNESTDEGFLADFPDVAQREMESWLALAPSLDVTLLSNELTIPSVPPHVSQVRLTSVRSLVYSRFEKKTHLSLVDIRAFLLTQAPDIAACAYFRQAELLGMFDGALACIEGVCVLVSVDDPAIDTLRRKILGLLYKQGGAVKRAEIMEVAGPTSQHTYTKVLSDLCTSKGNLWTIKAAEELQF
ncbi:polr3e-prov protein [Ostreococcus tauri]|uniref:Polr3e-prov protein n=1 Tax=Ostreococcus tauri TaxID=70448 RepID=A0A1Y5I6F9_OSTTA|nr:polr3e-prov protein [Ostreococcus tauri]